MVHHDVSGGDVTMAQIQGMKATTPPHRPGRPDPAEIKFKDRRFLITDQPTDAEILNFIEELKFWGVRDVVRVCEPTYSTEALSRAGIEVQDLQFGDGSAPTDEIVDKWFELIRARYRGEKDACIAVHCVAGLGRAPVLVALALIELGLSYEDAVALIRTKRRGAINAKQLEFLRRYKPRSRLRVKDVKSGCSIQ